MLKPIPLFVLLFGLLGSQGCGPKKSQAPQPLSEAQFVSEIENAFSDAQGAIPEKIETLITQYEDEEFIEAERTIDDLIYTETKSLNKAQRTILGRASITLFKLVNEQASEGDAEAVREMQRHLLTK